MGTKGLRGSGSEVSAMDSVGWRSEDLLLTQQVSRHPSDKHLFRGGSGDPKPPQEAKSLLRTR